MRTASKLFVILSSAKNLTFYILILHGDCFNLIEETLRSTQGDKMRVQSCSVFSYFNMKLLSHSPGEGGLASELFYRPPGEGIP
jgi:hypothetical protein